MSKRERLIDLISSIPFREESHYLGLSHTCFHMRHKLHRAVSDIVEKQEVTGKVQLDSNYQKINLEGKKPKNMPRFSKKRGNGSAYRGISHHKVCIVLAIDSQDNMFLRIVGLGCESIDKYDICKYKFENPEIIVSDSKSFIQQFANNVEAKYDKIPTKPDGKRYTTNLGDLNQLDSEITSLITRTQGVSTRFFQDYLNFLTYKKTTKYKHEREDVAEFIYNEIKDTKAFTNAELVYTELPISLKEACYEYSYGIFA